MKQVFFVGGYTTPETLGIHVLEIDTETGALTPLSVVPGIDNPIYFAIDQARKHLYVAQGDEPGGERMTNGAVAVYAIGKDFGLKLLDKRATHFSVPCYIALDEEEKTVLYAEYACAHAGVIGLKADGTFRKGDGVSIRHVGSGPNPNRQEAAHVHCAVAAPGNRLMMACDLGQDAVFAYDLKSWAKGLKERPEAAIRTAPGAGPRHLVFSADGRFAYLVNELSSTVQSFAFDGETFEERQTLPMLPPVIWGDSKAAAIRLSPDGRWLLASNRGHDSIAAYRVGPDGSLSGPVVSRLTGRFPRDFVFVPGSRFLLVGHKLSNELAVYAFDDRNGLVTRMAGTYRMDRPLAIALV